MLGKCQKIFTTIVLCLCLFVHFSKEKVSGLSSSCILHSHQVFQLLYKNVLYNTSHDPSMNESSGLNGCVFVQEHACVYIFMFYIRYMSSGLNV